MRRRSEAYDRILAEEALAWVFPQRYPQIAIPQLIRIHRWRLAAFVLVIAAGMAGSGYAVYHLYPHTSIPDTLLGPMAGLLTAPVLICTVIGVDVSLTWNIDESLRPLAVVQAITLTLVVLGVLGGVVDGKASGLEAVTYLTPALLAALTVRLAWAFSRAHGAALAQLGFFRTEDPAAVDPSAVEKEGF